MRKWIFTFMQKQETRDNFLVIEGKDEAEARKKVFDAIGGRFFTSYPYDDSAKEMISKFKLVEIALEDAVEILNDK